MTDDFGIAPRIVPSPLGEVVCRAVPESDGDVVFPVPGIERLPCRIAGMDAFMGFSVDPLQHANSPVLSREYVLEDIVSFFGSKGRRIGYVFIEDGEISHADVDPLVDIDHAIAKADMMSVCRRIHETTSDGGFVRAVNAVLAEVEGDCLQFRAAAARECARDLEREAIILEEEARTMAARGRGLRS